MGSLHAVKEVSDTVRRVKLLSYPIYEMRHQIDIETTFGNWKLLYEFSNENFSVELYRS